MLMLLLLLLRKMCVFGLQSNGILLCSRLSDNCEYEEEYQAENESSITRLCDAVFLPPADSMCYAFPSISTTTLCVIVISESTYLIVTDSHTRDREQK